MSGKLRGLADDQLGDARGAGGAYALPPDPHAVGAASREWCLRRLELGVPFGEAAGDVLAHHRLEQLFLAREIEEQGALGHAGAGRDFLAAGGGEAFFHEQVERGIEQFARARFLAAFALGNPVGYTG
jgi:hypothetical protein